MACQVLLVTHCPQMWHSHPARVEPSPRWMALHLWSIASRWLSCSKHFCLVSCLHCCLIKARSVHREESLTYLRSFVMQSLQRTVGLCWGLFPRLSWLNKTFFGMRHKCPSHRSRLSLMRVAIHGIFALAHSVMFGM